MVDTNFFGSLTETLAQIADMIKTAIDSIGIFIGVLPPTIGITLGAILSLCIGFAIVEVFT